MADEKAKGGKPQGGGQPKPQGGKPAGEKREKREKAGTIKTAAPKPRPKDYRPRMKDHYEKVVRDAGAYAGGGERAVEVVIRVEFHCMDGCVVWRQGKGLDVTLAPHGRRGEQAMRPQPVDGDCGSEHSAAVRCR